MSMKAKHDSLCALCARPIAVGDEIRKRNGGDLWAHAACVPVAGKVKCAGFRVSASGHPEQWEAVTKQYVARADAERYAEFLRNQGFAQVNFVIL